MADHLTDTNVGNIEYIRKADAIDALEAKKDKSAKGDIGCFYNTIIQNAIDALNGLPSADVAPVVRCENCVHWSDSNQCARPELSGSRWHDAKYFETMPDDFCSYGERREE